jgi:hypothetical protein
MSSRIDAGEIPVFAMDPAQTAASASWLASDAAVLRRTGSDVRSAWLGLSRVYEAPEAGQLCGVLDPMVGVLECFASDLAEVASAIARFADEAGPAARLLVETKRDAQAFRDRTSGTQHWDSHPDLVAENNGYLRAVDDAYLAFQAAERRCANAIEALIGGQQWRAGSDQNAPGVYGWQAIPDGAWTPWGESAKDKKSCGEATAGALQVFNPVDFASKWHLAQGVWSGVTGIATGLFWMSNFGAIADFHRFCETWNQVSILASAVTFSPVAVTTHGLRYGPELERKQIAAVTQTAKGLIGWDVWRHDPSKALGLSGVNVASMLVPAVDGASAGGDVAKFAGDAGKATDPVSDVGGFAKSIDAGRLPKVIDLVNQTEAIVGWQGSVGDLDAVIGRLPRYDLPVPVSTPVHSPILGVDPIGVHAPEPVPVQAHGPHPPDGPAPAPVRAHLPEPTHPPGRSHGTGPAGPHEPGKPTARGGTHRSGDHVKPVGKDPDHNNGTSGHHPSSAHDHDPGHAGPPGDATSPAAQERTNDGAAPNANRLLHGPRNLTKTDRLAEHLTERDLDAARRELLGEVVARKPNGTPFDHVDEVRNAQRGLVKRIGAIRRAMGNQALGQQQRQGLLDELSKASSLLDRSEDILPRP